MQPTEAVRRETLKLRENALARGLRHESGRRTEERLGALVHPEAELVLEAHRAQQSQRIVEEDALGHDADHAGVEIGTPVVRVVGVPRRDVLGDGVEREVARREVGVDPVRERREVDRLVDALGDDSPRAVPLGERERRAPEAPREAMCRVARIRARDVDVENRPQEQRVTHRAADDPGVLAAQDLAESLIHRSRPVVHAQSPC